MCWYFQNISTATRPLLSKHTVNIMLHWGKSWLQNGMSLYIVSHPDTVLVLVSHHKNRKPCFVPSHNIWESMYVSHLCQISWAFVEKRPSFLCICEIGLNHVPTLHRPFSYAGGHWLWFECYYERILEIILMLTQGSSAISSRTCSILALVTDVIGCPHFQIQTGQLTSVSLYYS